MSHSQDVSASVPEHLPEVKHPVEHRGEREPLVLLHGLQVRLGLFQNPAEGGTKSRSAALPRQPGAEQRSHLSAFETFMAPSESLATAEPLPTEYTKSACPLADISPGANTSGTRALKPPRVMNAEELDEQCAFYGLVYSDSAIRLLVRPLRSLERGVRPRSLSALRLRRRGATTSRTTTGSTRGMAVSEAETWTCGRRSSGRSPSQWPSR